MRIFRSIQEVPSGFGPSAVTIGKFDGVHTGHRAVIERVRAVAAQRGLASVVVTFDRHPLTVLNPAACPPTLVSREQKLQLLAGTGLDATLMLGFDRALSELSPEEFVTGILVNALGAQAVLVGADFRFGRRGAGSVDLLERLGAEHGFELIVIDDVTPDQARRVSSSWIRELLQSGDVASAARLLGALPTIRAVVVHGQHRGRLLGYPTANLSRQVEGFVPADGVYAGWLTARGIRYPAAVSIGNNPTFGDVQGSQVEAHVLDQTLDLYDELVDLAFVEYVRDMRAFAGADALAEQMAADERRVREILGVPAAS